MIGIDISNLEQQTGNVSFSSHSSTMFDHPFDVHFSCHYILNWFDSLCTILCYNAEAPIYPRSIHLSFHIDINLLIPWHRQDKLFLKKWQGISFHTHYRIAFIQIYAIKILRKITKYLLDNFQTRRQKTIFGFCFESEMRHYAFHLLKSIFYYVHGKQMNNNSQSLNISFHIVRMKYLYALQRNYQMFGRAPLISWWSRILEQSREMNIVSKFKKMKL